MFYEKIIVRLNQLIEMGEKVLSTKHFLGGGERVNDESFYQWKAEALSFLNNVFGDGSIYFKRFERTCGWSYFEDALQGQSFLKAAKEDIEGGYLKKLETLVAADIFEDFLEMAEHLVEQGYKDPSAMLVGAVLEDGLRKIAKNSDITLKSKEDVGSLNQKIAGAQIYNRLIQKKVHVWNEIRNKADHAEFDKYTLDDVKEMLKGVRDFLGEYLERALTA